MSDLPLKATLKSGTGYDAPWLTVDAETPAELQQRLRAVIDSGVLETISEAAGVFAGSTLTTPALAQQQAPALAQGSSFGGGDRGLNPPPAPQQSNGWGQAAQQQQSPPPQQQGGGNRYGGVPHPQGKQCQCGQVLEVKQTGSNKTVFRCSQWRWNNGNPTTNHDSEFAN